MSSDVAARTVASRRERLLAKASSLQLALGLLTVLSLLAAVVLAEQRALLLAVAAVCLLFVVFDYAMRGSGHSLSAAAMTAQADLIADIERELHLDSDGWYVPTEGGTVRRWHASTGLSAAPPPAPLPAGAFHDDEIAGVSVPTIGWALLEQTDAELPSRQASTAIEEALTICRRTGLVTEWETEARTAGQHSESVFGIRLTYSGSVPRDERIDLTLSLLGTAIAGIAASPVQLTVNDAEQRRRVVRIRVLSSGRQAAPA
ncbi:hypothetical protein [Salinigranum halophilum]|uniref:hypothetical protein n=1 Tax=Salinigranum halophilum TaxID=2565931 RepID=UPI0010A84D48|nr:hypothetical protein [Salinigranum halophilum]